LKNLKEREMISFYEANARERINSIIDEKSFKEILPSEQKIQSPHLGKIDIVSSFNDGVIIGSATIDSKPVLIASQEGKFMGGTVGEVHGAKILGLLKKAIVDKVSAVFFIIDSGGVRLHEANAGLIAISEIMRAIFELRKHNIPIYAIVGSQNGCFGGMGIVAGCCNAIVMNEEGRLGLSGPEVIETVHGVEEFDSKDKPLVWRTLGGKHRFIMGLIETIVSDTREDFRKASIELVNLNRNVEINLEDMLKEHERLAKDMKDFEKASDARDIWEMKNIKNIDSIPLLDNEAFKKLIQGN
jgi:malonate decarboxylase beta subunit